MASYAQSPMKPQFDKKEISDKLLDNLVKDNESQQFFSSLTTKQSNDALVKHVYQYLARYQLMPKKPYASKCDHFSQQSKDEGNKHFINEEYEEAVTFYNKAIKFATTLETISIAYANRSAALFRLKKYRESLLDIGRAIEAGYEERLMPKLLLRKKQCEQALELSRAVEAAAEEEKEKLRQELFRPPEKRMAGVSCASASLEISYSEFMGRSVMATEDIQPGQILVIEDPYVAVLNNNEHLDSRCYFCCSINYAMIPCETCTYVMYCNEGCQTESWNHGHKFECSIMSRLMNMYFAKANLTSLRILLKARCQHSSWDKLFETIESVEKETDPKLKGFTLDTKNDLSYDSNNYAPIHILTTNKEKLEEHKIFMACLSSALILYMLKEYTTFFADFPNVSDNNSIMEDDYFWRAGGLLLHHYMLKQINSHGIEIYFKNTLEASLKLRELATGIYAFSSLFSHSCSPNASRVFRGTAITIYASRPIKKGQHVCIHYGPKYLDTPKFDRHLVLEGGYHFKCECEACINNWPMLHRLQPANFISKKNKRQYRNILNEYSFENILESHKNINLNLVKRVIKHTAKLEKYAPCIELTYYHKFILTVFRLLGNFEPSTNNIYVDFDNLKL